MISNLLQRSVGDGAGSNANFGFWGFLPSNREILYSLLLLAVSNYGNGSHIYFFWQKRSVELIMIGSWPALRGGPEYNFKRFQLNFSVVQALFTVYLLHELKIPDS